MNKEEREEMEGKITSVFAKMLGCDGAILITLWHDPKGVCDSSVSIKVEHRLRGVLPALLRDLAMTCEKQNLMAHIKTEELNPEHETEIVHERTTRIEEL